MKKQMLLVMAAIGLSLTTVTAQRDGNFVRQTPEERVKNVHQKIDSALHLAPAKMALVDSIFLDYFKTRQNFMKKGSNTMPDRDAMMEARKKINDERDAKLKEVLSDEEMKKWKDEIEPALRPQRGSRANTPQ